MAVPSGREGGWQDRGALPLALAFSGCSLTGGVLLPVGGHPISGVLGEVDILKAEVLSRPPPAPVRAA